MRVNAEFGQLVTDAIGIKGLQETSVITEISKAYLGQLKKGLVPSDDIIHRFCTALEIPCEPFFEAAGKTRELNPEMHIHRAAEEAELTNAQRLKLLSFFRELREESSEQESAA